MLVTGGTGFIGSNLSLTLEKLGHHVLAADLNVTGQAPNLKGFQGEVLAFDTAKPWQVEGPIDAVFHQAALTDPRYHDDQEIFQKNVTGFQHAIRFALAKKARLIYASTAGLYGNGPVPMQEDQKKVCLTAYGRSKWEMDQIAEPLFSQLPIVGLRYFNVFGPRETGKGRPASMIYHLGKQIRETGRARIFEFGLQVRDHIYVKDVVTVNLSALQSSKSGVFNVGTGIGTSFNALVATLNEVLGTDAPIEFFKMPYAPETYQVNTVADTTRAKTEFNFSAEWDLKEAIRDYFHFLGWLK